MRFYQNYFGNFQFNNFVEKNDKRNSDFESGFNGPSLYKNMMAESKCINDFISSQSKEKIHKSISDVFDSYSKIDSFMQITEKKS